MDPAALIELSIEIIQDYNPLRVTPSTQCDLFFKKKKIKDPDVQSFVKEIFFGAERYQKMLKIVVDGLFAKHSSEVNRLDYNLYVVMSLIICKKQFEMGFDNFKKFILCQPPHKMHTLLHFLYLDAHMAEGGWLEEQWALVYDIHFVQNNLIGNMKKVGEQVRKLMAELDHTLKPTSLDDPEEAKARPKIFTTPKPFKLSASSPKQQKEPDPIYKVTFKANPKPDALESLEQINMYKEERRVEKLAENVSKYKHGEGRFNLATDSRPTNLERLKKEKQALDASRLKQYKAKPAPKFTHNSSTIKLTAAQILRDEALYQRRAAEEAAKLREFEENLRDETEFSEWQEKMKASDEEERLRIIEERRIDMSEASERAQAAVQQKIDDNKELVKDLRGEIDERLAERSRAIEADLEWKREEAKRMQKEKENIAVVIAQQQEQKRAEALKAQMAREERAQKAKRAKEVDMKKKKELIMAIQAMEKLAGARAKRPKDFDPSTASGVGLLEEMSLAELGERINLLKIREEEDRQRKRGLILVDKREKKDILDAMVNKHTKLRQVANAKRFEEHCSAKNNAAMEAAKKRRELNVAHKDFDKQQAAAQKAKRDRAMQLARELKAKRNAENFELSSSGGRVDAKDAAQAIRAERNQRDVDRGLARHAKELTRKNRRAAGEAQKVKGNDDRVRRRNRTVADRKLKQMRRDYDENLETLNAETEQLEGATSHMKKQYAHYAKGQRDTQVRKYKARNQYATDQTERALVIARAARNRPRSGRRARSADGQNRSASLEDSIEDELELTQVRIQRPNSSHETSAAAIDGVHFEQQQVPIAIA